MTTIALMMLFGSVSQTFNLPPGLLSSVCFVESSHNVHAMHFNDGGGNSVGICQLKLGTARLLGFKGDENSLKIPKNNVYFAAKYLRRQLDRYRGNVWAAVSAYNAGRLRLEPSGQTRNRVYVLKVLQRLKTETGYVRLLAQTL